MITRADAIEHLKKMLEIGKLHLYLAGKGDYQYRSPYADLPTDTEIILAAIGEYYRRGHTEVIPPFRSAILSLSKDPEDAWMATYYLSGYLWLQESEDILTEDLGAFAGDVLKNLLLLKENLIKNRNWIGVNDEKGLWGSVVGVVKVIANEYSDLGLDIDMFG